ncbi:unnamed protein product [Jaminaea pallidilutea]
MLRSYAKRMGPRSAGRVVSPQICCIHRGLYPAAIRQISTTQPSRAPDAASATLSPSEKEHLQPSSSTGRLGYLYFDSLYPIKLGFWDLRHFFVRTDHRSLQERLKNSITEASQVPHDFKIIGAEERLKDGGAFLSFTYNPTHSPSSPSATSPLEIRDQCLVDIESKLKEGLKRDDSLLQRALLSWGTKASVHVVRGKPWLEDLNRFPSLRLKVNLSGGDLSEEALWALLRPYGRITYIEKKPGEALVLFSRMRSATSARNCAHGLTLPDGTKLTINYSGGQKGKQVWDWLTNHPRLVLPAIAFLLGGFTYAVFDPIRAFFIETKLSHTFDLGNYRVYAWLKRNTVDLLIDSGDKEDEGGAVDWFERRAARESIQGWLREKPETFITIAGPRGSGKHKLLNASLPKNAKTLTIDCAEISRSVGGASTSSSPSAKSSEANAATGGGKMDSALISALANETGYWPVFGWLNSLNSMIDLAAVGLIGSKAGFSRPVEEQLGQVLEVTTKALTSARNKDAVRVESERKRRDKRDEGTAGTSTRPPVTAPTPGPSTTAGEKFPRNASTEQTPNISGDEIPSEKGLSQEAAAAAATQSAAVAGNGNDATRAQAPVVIIDNFQTKSLRSPMLYSVLVSWASSLVSSGVAHVIFVSDNSVAMSKEVGRALPDANPANNIVLADAERDRAREFVRSRLMQLRADGDAAIQKASTPMSKADGQSRDSAPGDSGSVLGSLAKPSFFTSQQQSTDPTSETASTSLTNEVLPAADAEWVDKLGGRLTDLENLIQKVSLGQTVPTAVSDIISRTVVELRKSFFGDDSAESSNLPWQRSTAWAVIKLLTQSSDGSVPYHWMLHSDTGGAFKGDETKLRAMEEANLLSVRHKDGRPSLVRAGRPVLLEAMRELVRGDATFGLTQDYLDSKASLSKSEAAIHGFENELKELVELHRLGAAAAKGVGARMEAVAKRMEAEQDKVAKLEAKMADIDAKLKAME